MEGTAAKNRCWILKLCKKQIILPKCRAERSGSEDVVTKTLLADCFKTFADDQKTGLLAARAIATTLTRLSDYRGSFLAMICC